MQLFQNATLLSFRSYKNVFCDLFSIIVLLYLSLKRQAFCIVNRAAQEVKLTYLGPSSGLSLAVTKLRYFAVLRKQEGIVLGMTNGNLLRRE